MLKYYVIIGFSRYTHKAEISKSTYDARVSKNDFSITSRFTIETRKGTISFLREVVNFIEFTKEGTDYEITKGNR